MERGGVSPLDVTTCRSQDCGAEIVFLKTRRGKTMPVNVSPTVADFRAPLAGEIEFQYGQHQPHFHTCVDAERFRGRD